jgi:tRNA G18 (ribose-2'-O)-methylase SpoU
MAAENTQLTHSEHRQSDKSFSLSIIANDITSPLNIGGLFRLCDALGIEKLYLCGKTPTPPNSKINKTSRSTEKYVEYEYHADAETLVKELNNTGTFIVSLEITSMSIAIGSDKFKQAVNKQTPVCLILGSENTGISQTLLSLSDITVDIPMHGNNSSMNVVSAASIACYELTRTGE